MLSYLLSLYHVILQNREGMRCAYDLCTYYWFNNLGKNIVIYEFSKIIITETQSSCIFSHTMPPPLLLPRHRFPQTLFSSFFLILSPLSPSGFIHFAFSSSPFPSSLPPSSLSVPIYPLSPKNNNKRMKKI